jgi:hypothetical protein
MIGARARQMRVRVLEMLERRARQFRTRKEIWPLRVPREPLLLDDVIEEALPDDHSGFNPVTLRSRMLLNLRWDDGSQWEAWIIALPSGLKLFCDFDGDESRVLASGKRDAEGVDVDKFFLELLSESAGEHFGIATSGVAPSRVRSTLRDRAFLVDVFVNLFEVAGTEDTVRDDLNGRGRPTTATPEEGADFRTDVERWLENVLVSG